MSEPLTVEQYFRPCPTCGAWAKFSDAARVAPSDGLRDEIGDIAAKWHGRYQGLRRALADEPNHYEWFMPDDPTAAVGEYLDDFEAKMTDALTDPFVHDMAQSVLPLIAAYRAALATTGQRESEVHGESGLRAAIEQDARFQDALDALDLATLWLHRTCDLPHMPSHQADSWERKARSGRVALKRALTPEATAPEADR
jgi:hypothetical protein